MSVLANLRPPLASRATTAGTHSPNNPCGVALLSELEHYVRGGLTPAEAMGLGADLAPSSPASSATCSWSMGIR